MASIHEYVVDQLKAHTGKWPEVAAGSGVPYGTLKKIARGTSKHPRIDNLEKLALYFRGRSKRGSSYPELAA